jgi:RNA polymerase sigma-70 factor (ECF subfamily)
MLEKRFLTINKLTDELRNIIQGCIDNNRMAQEQLYRMFAAKMYGICMRYSQNSEEAQDSLQDGFIKIFEKIYQFKNTGPFEGWMRKIMVNTSLESFRKKKHTQLTYQIPDVEEENPEDGNLGLTEKELVDMIRDLPERYQMVFNLYVFEEMTHKEIAQELGITEGTSKSDLSRARGILQNKINTITKRVFKIG